MRCFIIPLLTTICLAVASGGGTGGGTFICAVCRYVDSVLTVLFWGLTIIFILFSGLRFSAGIVCLLLTIFIFSSCVGLQSQTAMCLRQRSCLRVV